MTSRKTFGAASALALLAFTAPLAAKTISFTAHFEAENLGGIPYPLAEQPATLEVEIGIDETSEPDVTSEGDPGESFAGYGSAVTSFTYEAFGAGGNTLGSWAAFDAELAIANLSEFDGIFLESNTITGPLPLERMILNISGDANLFADASLDMLAAGTLGAMTAGEVFFILDVEGAPSLGMQFLIDFNSVDVVDGAIGEETPLAPVPLPAGMPLLLGSLAAFVVWRRRTQPNTGQLPIGRSV